MPTQRLSMRRIKQLLTMRFGAGASTREIARELGVAPSTVREYLGRAAAAGIGWPLAADATDESLMARLFVNAGVRSGARYHAEPDWAALVRELKRPGVNLTVLWEEYRTIHPQGYAYSRFCELFREFERRLSPTMRQQHAAGQAGQKHQAAVGGLHQRARQMRCGQADEGDHAGLRYGGAGGQRQQVLLNLNGQLAGRREHEAADGALRVI